MKLSELIKTLQRFEDQFEGQDDSEIEFLLCDEPIEPVSIFAEGFLKDTAEGVVWDETLTFRFVEK